MDDLKKTGPNFLCCVKLSKPLVKANWSYCLETPNSGQNQNFLHDVTSNFDIWPWKSIGHLFYATPSFVQHFEAISEFKLESQPRNPQFGWKSAFFCPDRPWNLMDDIEKEQGTSSLRYFKRCASFYSHQWIQTGVTVPKLPIRVKIGDFSVLCDLQIWWMTIKNNRTPLLCYFKLCASFHSHLWIQTGVTVRKLPIWVKIGDFFVLCDLEIWQMTLKNNRTPLLCYFKLCASFHSHWRI